MSPKLSAANPYLRDRELRERTVVQSVATSSAIEGIRTPFKRRAKTRPTLLKSKQKSS